MSQTHVEPDRGSPPGTPRWVKVFGILFVVLVLLFGILHFTGHHPGSHTSPLEHGVHQP